MKQHTAGIAAVAALGFSALSMAPASAAPIVFDNCTQAAQYGVYNIPEGQPGYGRHLDRPYDGVGCEKSGVAYNPNLVPDDSPVPPTTPMPPVDQPPQVGQVPVGGADTGVVVEESTNEGGLALGGGLALAAAVGAAVVVRRRAAQA